MSTEVVEKKQKGGKDGAEKRSKKRPREEEQATTEDAETAVEAESTPAKKQKKSKKDKEQAVEQESPGVQEAVTATPEAESVKKDKKDKKKRRKSADEPVAEQNADSVKPESTENVPIAEDPPAVIEPDQTKKSKIKKKKDLASTVPDPNEAASTAPTSNSVPESQPAAKSTKTAIDDKLLQSSSPFVQQTASFYLALSPIAHHFPLEGLVAEHISPLLLTYYPPLKGVVLSFSKPRLSEHPESGVKAESSKQAKTVLGQSIDEYAVTYIWLTAEFLMFRPQKGAVLEGHVTLQNESILGLICYNYFNAGVERSRIPKDWQWIADESAETEASMSRKGRRDAAGHYVDGEGKKVEGRIVFRVNDFEATAGAENGVGSINIYGTLLARGDDAKVDDEAAQKGLVSTRSSRR